MIEEVFPNIFRTKIPLPGSPLKAINSYLIRGGDRFLMVDTGMNRVECMEAMQSSLKELQVNLKHTDFFITHIHADHLGLVSELVQDSSKIYFNYPDTEIINDPNHWEEIAVSALKNGFPESDVQAAHGLYNVLEQKVIPTFYNNQEKWIEMQKHSISLASYYNTNRMLREYIERAWR
jgi:glyoxylase-like metal-dependent hydrolase (beta-lactamase superfamily II)